MKDAILIVLFLYGAAVFATNAMYAVIHKAGDASLVGASFSLFIAFAALLAAYERLMK